MLKKSDKFILRKEREFFSSALREHQKHFSIFWKENNSRLLLLVIIARGVARNSVERNGLKRAVYEVLETVKTTHKAQPKSIVVIVKNKRVLENKAELTKHLELVITR